MACQLQSGMKFSFATVEEIIDFRNSYCHRKILTGRYLSVRIIINGRRIYPFNKWLRIYGGCTSPF